MRVLNVEHRDVHFTVEFSAKQLRYIRKLFDHAEIEYDGSKDTEMAEADKYLQETLYPFLVKLEEDFISNDSLKVV